MKEMQTRKKDQQLKPYRNFYEAIGELFPIATEEVVAYLSSIWSFDNKLDVLTIIQVRL